MQAGGAVVSGSAIAYYPCEPIYSTGGKEGSSHTGVLTAPYLKEFRLSNKRVVYQPPSTVQLHNAGVLVNMKALAESYSALPTVHVEVEEGTYAFHFRERPGVSEEEKVGRLCMPGPFDWDSVIADSHASAHRTSSGEDDQWDEEFWRAISLTRDQERRARDDRKRRKFSKAVARASVSSVGGSLVTTSLNDPSLAYSRQLSLVSPSCVPADGEAVHGQHRAAAATDADNRLATSASRTASAFLRRARFNGNLHGGAPLPAYRKQGRTSLDDICADPKRTSGSPGSATASGFRFPAALPSLTSLASNWGDCHAHELNVSIINYSNLPSTTADIITPTTARTVSGLTPVRSFGRTAHNTSTYNTSRAQKKPVDTLSRSNVVSSQDACETNGRPARCVASTASGCHLPVNGDFLKRPLQDARTSGINASGGTRKAAYRNTGAAVTARNTTHASPDQPVGVPPICLPRATSGIMVVAPEPVDGASRKAQLHTATVQTMTRPVVPTPTGKDIPNRPATDGHASPFQQVRSVLVLEKVAACSTRVEHSDKGTTASSSPLLVRAGCRPNGSTAARDPSMFSTSPDAVTKPSRLTPPGCGPIGDSSNSARAQPSGRSLPSQPSASRATSRETCMQPSADRPFTSEAMGTSNHSHRVYQVATSSIGNRAVVKRAQPVRPSAADDSNASSQAQNSLSVAQKDPMKHQLSRAAHGEGRADALVWQSEGSSAPIAPKDEGLTSRICEDQPREPMPAICPSAPNAPIFLNFQPSQATPSVPPNALMDVTVSMGTATTLEARKVTLDAATDGLVHNTGGEEGDLVAGEGRPTADACHSDPKSQGNNPRVVRVKKCCIVM